MDSPQRSPRPWSRDMAFIPPSQKRPRTHPTRKSPSPTPFSSTRTPPQSAVSHSRRLPSNLPKSPSHPADLLSRSDSESSSDENDEDEALAAGSDDLAASENDISEYDLSASDEEEEERPITPVRRSKSMSASMSIPFIRGKLNLRKSIWKDRDSSVTSVTPLRPHPDTTSSDTALLTTSKAKNASSILSTSPSLSQASPRTKAEIRPPPIRHQSLPKFTSKPVPRTTIPASEDGPGPSIMFADTPSPSEARKKDPIGTSVDVPSASTSLPDRTNPEPDATRSLASQATGFPLQQAIPLSFNDLPCRAQHLILNELIRQHSSDTAVVFTTLPSPMEGTCESEGESVKYISDLEVLCQGLPPVLLVHSNSMTVTMNL